jgi:mRNA interferase MazF
VRLCKLPPPDKSRPVLVLTRPSALEFLTRVTVAPITSTIRGAPTEVVLGVDDGLRQRCAANLDNIVTLRREELGRLVATVRPERMREVCAALVFALGCES